MPQGNNMDCKVWPLFKLIAKILTHLNVTKMRTWMYKYPSDILQGTEKSFLHPRWCKKSPFSAYSSWVVWFGWSSCTSFTLLMIANGTVPHWQGQFLLAVLPHSSLDFLYPAEQMALAEPQYNRHVVLFKLKLQVIPSSENICISCACRLPEA